MQRTLVVILLLGLSSCVRSGDIQAAAELSPTQLREDVDFLFLQLERSGKLFLVLLVKIIGEFIEQKFLKKK